MENHVNKYSLFEESKESPLFQSVHRNLHLLDLLVKDHRPFEELFRFQIITHLIITIQPALFSLNKGSDLAYVLLLNETRIQINELL